MLDTRDIDGSRNITCLCGLENMTSTYGLLFR